MRTAELISIVTEPHLSQTESQKRQNFSSKRQQYKPKAQGTTFIEPDRHKCDAVKSTVPSDARLKSKQKKKVLEST